jgi:hypothetical protein
MSEQKPIHMRRTTLTKSKSDVPTTITIKITPDTYRYFRKEVRRKRPFYGRHKDHIESLAVDAFMSHVLRLVARDKMIDAIFDDEPPSLTAQSSVNVD